MVLDGYAEEWILPTSHDLALVTAMLHTSPRKEGQVDDQRQSRRWLTRKRVLWTVCIIAVIVGAYVLLRFAYVREWKWTGLVKDPDYHKRTLWDWLNLLIVPAVLALGGYLFTRSENRRSEKAAEDREIPARLGSHDSR